MLTFGDAIEAAVSASAAPIAAFGRRGMGFLDRRGDRHVDAGDAGVSAQSMTVAGVAGASLVIDVVAQVQRGAEPAQPRRPTSANRASIAAWVEMPFL